VTGPTLILDSEAVVASSRPSPADAVTLAAIRRNQQPMVVPAVVLAEVLTGRPADAPVARFVKSTSVCPISQGIATRAGALRERASAARRKKRDLTVDAIVASTAQEFTPAAIVTGDTVDMALLVTGPGIKVMGV